MQRFGYLWSKPEKNLMYKLSDLFGKRKTVNTYLGEAFQKRDNKDFKGAIETLLRGTKMYPQSFRIFAELGRLCADYHDASGKTDQDAIGLWAFKNAYELDPQNLKNLDAYAKFLKKKGRHEDARHRFAEIVFLTTSDLDAGMLARLGALYKNSGQYRLALACMGKAAMMKRHDASLQRDLQQLESELNTVFDVDDWAEAENYFRQIIDTSSGSFYSDENNSDEIH